MSEDEKPSEVEPEKPVKADTSAAVTKLLILVGIVFALTKWGLPLMEDMVDEFKKKQKKEEVVENSDENPNSDDSEEPEDVESNDEDKLKLAIEKEINKWIKKRSPESSATVKFINANKDGSRLAVEYVEKNVSDEDQSKELLFTKDEFGIYIYQDAAGVRQIRVRQPK